MQVSVQMLVNLLSMKGDVAKSTFEEIGVHVQPNEPGRETAAFLGFAVKLVIVVILSVYI